VASDAGSVTGAGLAASWAAILPSTKTERIRDQLGSAGQVIEERITRRLAEGGIVEARNLARECAFRR
jgi:hypothetical protein